MVTRLSEIEEKRVCERCIITKQRCVPFPMKSKYREATLDMVYGNLYRPIMLMMLGSRRFLLLIVNATFFMWTNLITAMSDAVSAIKKVKGATELKVSRSLWVLRTDNDNEFTTKEFIAYYVDEGV
jgi:hypothetical protein